LFYFRYAFNKFKSIDTKHDSGGYYLSFELTYYFDPIEFEELFGKLKKEIPLEVFEEETFILAKNRNPETFVKMWIHSQINKSGKTTINVTVLVKSDFMKERIIGILGHPEKIDIVKPTLLDFALAVLEHRKKKSYDEIISAVMEDLGLTERQVNSYLRMLRAGVSLPSARREIKDAYEILEKKK